MTSRRSMIVRLVSASSIILGCATGPTPEGPSGSSQGGAAGANGGGGGSTNTGSSTGMFDTDGGIVNGDKACVADVQEGKPLPLDMYIMLDASGSMLALTPQGITKWEAVATAIADFVYDPASIGIGVGLQFFPIPVPGGALTCSTHDDCGTGAPCESTFCDQDTDVVFCQDQSDCQNPLSNCVPAGRCQLDTSYICVLGGRCGPLGDCIDFQPRYCSQGAACDVASYAVPAVPITALSDGAGPIIDAINARMEFARTPTGPALRGALDHTKDWAANHPDHAVVAVLATDGLPTECLPTDIPQIALIAESGLAGTPSIRTFVIGVSSPDDLDSPDNLAAIAEAGGTGAPFFVDSAADVTAQFQEALNKIRGTVLQCEFQIPAPEDGQMLDFKKVNLTFTSGSDVRELGYVAGRESCASTDNGWYYDIDPSTGETPTKIHVCPNVCDAFKSSINGIVNLEIGCATREAIIR